MVLGQPVSYIERRGSLAKSGRRLRRGMLYMGAKNELSYAKWAGPAIPFGWDSYNTDTAIHRDATTPSHAPTASVAWRYEK